MLQLQENIKAKKEHFKLVQCWLLIKFNGKKRSDNLNGHRCDNTKCEICSKKLQIKDIDLNIKSVLLEGNTLQNLILNKPLEIYKLHSKIYRKLIVDFGYNRDFINQEFSELFVISGYSRWYVSNGHNYSLAKNLNRSTCTYCNRTYTSTLKSRDNEKIMVPQFDHWFTKSRFPLLALSFYNLIPSCSICNSSVKSNVRMRVDKVTHPYLDNLISHFSFGYRKKSFIENNVIIKDESTLNKRARNALNAFRTKEIYNAHSSTELRDLLDMKYKYNDNYLDILFHKTFKGNISEPDKYRFVFGVELDERDFHKRPFSKFKKDILKELKIIS